MRYHEFRPTEGIASAVPMMVFYRPAGEKNREGVILIRQLEEGKLTLDIFHPNGPSCRAGGRVMRDFYGDLVGYREDPAGAAILDGWVTTPAWEEGMRQIRFMAYWNTFSFYGRYDLCRQLDGSPTLEAALALGQRLLAAELPEAILY